MYEMMYSSKVPFRLYVIVPINEHTMLQYLICKMWPSDHLQNCSTEKSNNISFCCIQQLAFGCLGERKILQLITLSRKVNLMGFTQSQGNFSFLEGNKLTVWLCRGAKNLNVCLELSPVRHILYPEQYELPSSQRLERIVWVDAVEVCLSIALPGAGRVFLRYGSGSDWFLSLDA